MTERGREAERQRDREAERGRERQRERERERAHHLVHLGLVASGERGESAGADVSAVAF